MWKGTWTNVFVCVAPTRGGPVAPTLEGDEREGDGMEGNSGDARAVAGVRTGQEVYRGVRTAFPSNSLCDAH